MGKSLVAAKLNLRNIGAAYLITAVTVGCMMVQDIVFLILKMFDINPNGPENATISFGNYFFLLLVFSAIFIPSRNFHKMMNLGGKRADFFKGCAINHAIMAAAISLISIILYHTADKFMISALYGGGTLDVVYWFGWIGNGSVVAFFQQFAFLLLLAVVIHTLTAAQGKWYGWAADIVIVAVIAVFIPIPALRPVLIWFFNMVIFHQYAAVQISFCLLLACAVYALNRPIFARKAI
ncbi:MAG: hypothetical protein FWG31_06985 [Oscillospiraceae bacterium]|nr:hypothetical protein [Oscillospiraceae bacterium]